MFKDIYIEWDFDTDLLPPPNGKVSYVLLMLGTIS